MSERHYRDIEAFQRGPLAYAVYLATRDIVVFKDVPGAGWSAIDAEKTAEARAKVAERVEKEFAAKQQENK